MPQRAGESADKLLTPSHTPYVLSILVRGLGYSAVLIANIIDLVLSDPNARNRALVSRNEASTAFRPSVVIAYTNDGYLRGVYR
jgi:hypothetical protein